MMYSTQMEMIERYPMQIADTRRSELTAPTATQSAARKALTYLIYHYVEMPIKRTARKIAHSGHWSY